MIEPELMVPVTCPQCGRESLCALSVAGAADALMAGKAIVLHVDCHSREWEADLSEREQLREYLGTAGIRSSHVETNLTEQTPHTAPPRSHAYSVFLHTQSSDSR